MGGSGNPGISRFDLTPWWGRIGLGFGLGGMRFSVRFGGVFGTLLFVPVPHICGLNAL